MTDTTTPTFSNPLNTGNHTNNGSSDNGNNNNGLIAPTGGNGISSGGGGSGGGTSGMGGTTGGSNGTTGGMTTVGGPNGGTGSGGSSGGGHSGNGSSGGSAGGGTVSQPLKQALLGDGVQSDLIMIGAWLLAISLLVFITGLIVRMMRQSIAKRRRQNRHEPMDKTDTYEADKKLDNGYGHESILPYLIDGHQELEDLKNRADFEGKEQAVQELQDSLKAAEAMLTDEDRADWYQYKAEQRWEYEQKEETEEQEEEQAKQEEQEQKDGETVEINGKRYVYENGVMYELDDEDDR